MELTKKLILEDLLDDLSIKSEETPLDNSIPDITSDFDTICDKLENRMLYLNRQECIRSEQYYKSQCRLAKMNYNIMHHDRRC